MGGKTDLALSAIANRFGAQEPRRVGIEHLRSLAMPPEIPSWQPQPFAPPMVPYGTSGAVDTVYFPLSEAISGTIGHGVKEATGNPVLGFAAEMISPSPTQIVKGLGRLGKPMVSKMTGWHGSPHKFDPEQLVRLPSGETAYVGGKFNALKEAPPGSTLIKDFPAGRFRAEAMGTGEGAQVYGKGAAYLAESPEVAKSYQALHGAVELQKNGNRVAMYGGGNKGVLDELARHGGNFDKAIAEQERLAKDYNGMFAGNANKIKKTLEEWKTEGYEAVPLGSLYKTDIPDEAVAKMLDLDKPISEQSKAVQDFALKNRVALKKLVDQQRSNPLNAEFAPKTIYDLSGGEAFRGLGYKGENIEQAMRQAGIPGIRYLDAGSRGAGEGTMNYVPFDPDLIRIIERDGVPTGAKPWRPGEWLGLGTKVEQAASLYTLGDVTRGLPATVPAAATRVIDDNALRALRVKATELEDAKRGISLYVTHDGQAIVSKPYGKKTPDRLKAFAEENNLEYHEATWRGPVTKQFPLHSTAMPLEYRESGAKYHWE